jgi:hypothetical protein
MKEEIKEKLKSKRVLGEKDENWATDTMDHCLMSTDKRIIESVLYGNLALEVPVGISCTPKILADKD